MSSQTFSANLNLPEFWRNYLVCFVIFLTFQPCGLKRWCHPTSTTAIPATSLTSWNVHASSQYWKTNKASLSTGSLIKFPHEAQTDVAAWLLHFMLRLYYVFLLLMILHRGCSFLQSTKFFYRQSRAVDLEGCEKLLEIGFFNCFPGWCNLRLDRRNGRLCENPKYCRTYL